MKLYFATWMLEKGQGVALTNCGARNRLLSYHYLVDVPKEDRREYFRKGKVNETVLSSNRSRK